MTALLQGTNVCDESINIFFPGCPAGAETAGTVIFIILAPEGKGVLFLQLMHPLIGKDGKLLIGMGIIEERDSLFCKGCL